MSSHRSPGHPLLAPFTESGNAMTDLKIAHLHLAYAYYFRANRRGQNAELARTSSGLARDEAHLALGSGTSDPYINSHVSWLLERIPS